MGHCCAVERNQETKDNTINLSKTLQPQNQFYQYCNTVIMIQPTAFYTNLGCLADNAFMKNLNLSKEKIQAVSHKQWVNYRDKLKQAGVKVIQFRQQNQKAPDSVWPDWFTTLKIPQIPEGLYIIYPMNAFQRRLERNDQVLAYLSQNYKNCLDLTHFEQNNQALQGKGACVFDVRNRKIYALLSTRSTLEVINYLVLKLNELSGGQIWRSVIFQAIDQNGKPIYHTDCVLTLFEKHALCCLDCVKDEKMKQNLISQLTQSRLNEYGSAYEIMDIALNEMKCMVCNGLCLRSDRGKHVITMSKQAFDGCSEGHLAVLKESYQIVVADIRMLEDIGGGSTRCLLAENF